MTKRIAKLLFALSCVLILVFAAGSIISASAAVDQTYTIEVLGRWNSSTSKKNDTTMTVTLFDGKIRTGTIRDFTSTSDSVFITINGTDTWPIAFTVNGGKGYTGKTFYGTCRVKNSSGDVVATYSLEKKCKTVGVKLSATASIDDPRVLTTVIATKSPDITNLGSTSSCSVTVKAYDQNGVILRPGNAGGISFGFEQNYNASTTATASVDGRVFTVTGSGLSTAEYVLKPKASWKGATVYSDYKYFSRTSYTLTTGVNNQTPTPNSASGQPGSISGAGTYKFGSTVTLTATPAEGYKFVQWKKSGTDTVNNNASFSYTTAEKNEEWVAYFTAKSVSLLLNKTGGSGSSSVSATYTRPLSPITPPTRPGYRFLGYYTGTDGTGVKYYNADGTGATNCAITADSATLYAYWTEADYTLTFNAAGAAFEGNNTKTVKYNSTYGTLPGATMWGANFLGWAFTNNASAPSFTARSTVNITQNTTVYAVWEIIDKSTLSFSMAGGSGEAPQNINVYEGLKVTLPTVETTKAGYLAMGWKSPDNTLYQFGSAFTAGTDDILFEVYWLSDEIRLDISGLESTYTNPQKIEFNTQLTSLLDIQLTMKVTANGVAVDSSSYSLSNGIASLTPTGSGNRTVVYRFIFEGRHNNSLMFSLGYTTTTYFIETFDVIFDSSPITEVELDCLKLAIDVLKQSGLEEVDDYTSYIDFKNFDQFAYYMDLEIPNTKGADSDFTVQSSSANIKAQIVNGRIQLVPSGEASGVYESILTVTHTETGISKRIRLTVKGLGGRLYIVRPQYATGENLIASMNGVMAAGILPEITASYTPRNGVPANIVKINDGLFLFWAENAISGNITLSYASGSETVSTTVSTALLNSYATYSGFTVNGMLLECAVTVNLDVRYPAENRGGVKVNYWVYVNGKLLSSDTRTLPYNAGGEQLQLVISGLNEYVNSKTLKEIYVVYEISDENYNKTDIKYFPQLFTESIYKSGNKKLNLNFNTTIELMDLDTAGSIMRVTDNSAGEQIREAPEGYVFVTKDGGLRLEVSYFDPDGDKRLFLELAGRRYAIAANEQMAPAGISFNFTWYYGITDINVNDMTPGSLYRARLLVVNSRGKTIKTETLESCYFVRSDGISSPTVMKSLSFLGNLAGGSVDSEVTGGFSMNMSFPSILPVGVSYDLANPIKGTFIMVIGKTFDNGDDPQREYRQLADQLARGNKSMSKKLSFDANILGYAFGTLDYVNGEWNMTFAGGGIAASIAVGWQYQQTMIVGFVPVYYGISVGMEVSVDALLAGKNSYHDLFNLELEYDFVSDVILAVEGNLTVSAGIGFDLCIVALKFGAEGELTLAYQHRFVNFLNNGSTVYKVNGGEFSATVAIRCVFEARFLFWETRIVLGEASVTTTKTNGYWDSFPDGRPDPFSALNDNTGGISVYSAAYMLNGDTDYRWGNVYPYADPQYSSDGSSFAFIDYNEEMSALNYIPAIATQKEDGTYQITRLEDFRCGGADNLALNVIAYGKDDISVLAYDAALYSPTVTDLAGALEVYNTSAVYAAVITANGTKNITRISAEGQTASTPQVYVRGDKAVVVWQSSSLSCVNGMLQYSDTELWYSYFDGQSWSAPCKIESGSDFLALDYSVAVNKDGNIAVVATGRKPSSDNPYDNEIKMYFTSYRVGAGLENVRTVFLTDNEQAELNAQLTVVNDSGDDIFITGFTRVYTSEGDDTEYALVTFGYNGQGTPIERYTYESERNQVGSEFVLINGGSADKLYTVWIDYSTKRTGTPVANLLIFTDDGAELSAPFKLNGASSVMITDSHAYYDIENGTVNAILLHQQPLIGEEDALDENSDDTLTVTANAASMSFVSGAPWFALDDNYFYLDADADSAGTVSVTLTANNTTSLALKGISVKIDGKTTLYRVNVAPGENAEITFNMPVEAGDVEIILTPVFIDGSNGPETREQLTVTRPDIVVEMNETTPVAGGEREAEVFIHNAGDLALTDGFVRLSLTSAGDKETITYVNGVGASIDENGNILIDSDAFAAINNGSYSLKIRFNVSSYNDSGIAVYAITAQAVNEYYIDIADKNQSDNSLAFSVKRQSTTAGDAKSDSNITTTRAFLYAEAKNASERLISLNVVIRVYKNSDDTLVNTLSYENVIVNPYDSVIYEIPNDDYYIEVDITENKLYEVNFRLAGSLADDASFAIAGNYLTNGGKYYFTAGRYTVSLSESVYGGQWQKTLVFDETTSDALNITYEFYTVTLTDERFSANSSTVSYLAGEEKVLPIPAQRGYRLKGWYVSRDLSGTANSVLTTSEAGNKTLYAGWEISETYSITYNLRGGTISGDYPQSYAFDDVNAVALPQPDARTGFVFEGWYDSPEYENDAITQIPAGAFSDYILYAKWRMLPSDITESGYSGAYDGLAHTISVTATHDIAEATFEYSWYKNGITDDCIIIGANTAVLSVSDVADSGTYYCRVTAVLDDEYQITTSDAITVTITPITLTHNVVPAKKVYDGSTAVRYNGSLTNVLTGDDVSLKVSLDFNSANINEATYITATLWQLSGVDKGNYILPPFEPVNGSILNAAITYATIALGTDMTVNYYATLSEGYTASYMRFTMSGVVTIVNGVATGEPGLYRFDFEGIAPQCMGNNIKAELILNNEVIDTKETYSVLTYCKNMLAKSDTELSALLPATATTGELRTLLADMLEYGAAAQIFIGYKADENTLVNKDITGKSTFTDPGTDKSFNELMTNTKGATFTVATLLFDNVNNLCFKFRADDIDGVTVKLKKNNEAFAEIAYEPYDSQTGMYIVITDAIFATGFDDVYTIDLCVDDVTVQTVTYSVKSYVHSMQNSENAAMKYLAETTYNYGKSAQAYLSAE